MIHHIPDRIAQDVMALRRVRDRMKNGVDTPGGHIPADTYQRDISEWIDRQRAKEHDQ